ncbi:hypothetical protein ACSBR1_026200 [Camellia fascicularis]
MQISTKIYNNIFPTNQPKKPCNVRNGPLRPLHHRYGRYGGRNGRYPCEFQSHRKIRGNRTTRLLAPAYVHVISKVPNNPSPLVVRCQSKTTDFGNHTLYTDQEFYWKFSPNIFGRTLYFCHFYSGSKNKIIDVYNQDIDGLCDNNDLVECYWQASPDGFYSQ